MRDKMAPPPCGSGAEKTQPRLASRRGRRDDYDARRPRTGRVTDTVRACTGVQAPGKVEGRHSVKPPGRRCRCGREAYVARYVDIYPDDTDICRADYFTTSFSRALKDYARAC